MLLVIQTHVTRVPPDFWVSDANFVDYSLAHNVDYYSFYDFAAVSSDATASTGTRRLLLPRAGLLAVSSAIARAAPPGATGVSIASTPPTTRSSTS